MRIVLSALTCAAILLLGGMQLVQAEQAGAGDKHRDRLEIITMWKIIEALDLDNATASKIMEIRREFVARKREIKKELDSDLQKLRQDVKSPSSDETEISRLLQSIRDKRKKLIGLHSQQYDDVAKILPVRKQAELVLFLKDFQKELRMLRRRPFAPQDAERMGPPRPPDGPPMGPGMRGPGRGDGRPGGLPPGAAGHPGPPGLAPGPDPDED